MYRWVDHTAELELRLEAADELGVFAEGLRALAELLGAERGAAQPVVLERRVRVEAPDRAALLAQWLDELVFLAETEDLVPERMVQATLQAAGPQGDRSTPARLDARVQGYRGQPRHLVKAVTYHHLAFARREPGGAWQATCVLDV